MSAMKGRVVHPPQHPHCIARDPMYRAGNSALPCRLCFFCYEGGEAEFRQHAAVLVWAALGAVDVFYRDDDATEVPHPIQG